MKTLIILAALFTTAPALACTTEQLNVRAKQYFDVVKSYNCKNQGGVAETFLARGWFTTRTTPSEINRTFSVRCQNGETMIGIMTQLAQDCSVRSVSYEPTIRM